MQKKLLIMLFPFALFFLACNSSGEPKDDGVPLVNWGELKRIDFNSEWVEGRFVDILLPEGYDPNFSYPVIYMQDGQMLFDSSISWNRQSWLMAEVIAELARDEDFTPPIIVGIHNNGELRFAEYFPAAVIDFVPEEVRDEMLAKLPGQPLSDEYLRFLVTELKPFIDENFSTRQGPRNTYIVGASMGALISIYALCEYPAIFSAAACLSTHWLGPEPEDRILPAAYAEYLKANIPSPMRHRIYFDLGDQGLDAVYQPFQLQVDSVMMGLGYVFGEDWLTVVLPGEEHNEISWNRRIGSALSFLMRDR